MKTKGSLRRIPDKIEKEISEYAIKIEKDTPREELAHKLRKKFGVESPSLQTLMRKISHARNYQSPLDITWNMGLTTKYNLPAEALFNIGILQSFCRSHLEPPHNTPFPPLSVRQALWAARLYPYMSLWETSKVKGKQKGWGYYLLYLWSEAFAGYERICELSSTPFDTTDLEKKLLAGEHPLVATLRGEKYESILFFSQDNRVSRITAKDGEK